MARGQSFEGTWTQIERSMTVTIESWGPDCPTQPQSYSRRTDTPVSVTQDGDQLVFPRGYRSDRCWSDNPAMRRTRFSKSGNRWTIECQTPEDDARREHGIYVLTASESRIEIELISNYDWTLRDSNCKARTVERRVLTRTPPVAPDAGVAAVGAPDARPEIAQPAEAVARVIPEPRVAPQRCEHLGPPVELRLRTVRSVPPGGRTVIAVHPVDAQGCDLGAARASFELIGDAKGCRIDPDGTFHACKSVAQCDGETVRVRATVGALSATVAISIAARIEDGLGTVTPIWVDEKGQESAAPVGGAQIAASLEAQPQEGPGEMATGLAADVAVRDREDPRGLWVVWLLVGGGGAVVLAAAVYLFTAARRRRPLGVEIEEPASMGASEEPPAPQASVAARRPAEVPTDPLPVLPEPKPVPAPAVWHCAACRRSYAAAGFCAEDGLSLLTGPAPTGPKTVIFAACPKCGRGYSPESKFCAVDKELLQPYGMGMNNYRVTLKGRPEPPERSCPKCGVSYPGSNRFCTRDGELLMPAR